MGDSTTPQPFGPLLLGVREAATTIGVSRSVLYELIRRGDLETVSIGARRLVPRTALIDFVQRLRAEQRRSRDDA